MTPEEARQELRRRTVPRDKAAADAALGWLASSDEALDLLWDAGLAHLGPHQLMHELHGIVTTA